MDLKMAAKKKRGVKPGTKRGPYNKHSHLTADVDKLTAELRTAIKAKIKYLNMLLKRI